MVESDSAVDSDTDHEAFPDYDSEDSYGNQINDVIV